jgi:hypothetical protein
MSFLDGLESQTIEFDLDYKGKKYHFVMKEVIAIDDASDVELATSKETGLTNQMTLWARRLSRSLAEPKLTVNECRRLPNSIMDALMRKWMKINTWNEVDFLRDSKKDESNPQS